MRKKVIVNLYSRKANRYDSLVRTHPGFEDLKKEVIKCGNVKEGEKILDIGAGAGYYSLDFSKIMGKEGKIVLLDISEKMLRHVPEDLKSEKTDFITGDAETLPFKAKTFDFLLCINVLRYTEAKESIKEMKRILKPKGRVIIIDVDRKQLFFDFNNGEKGERISKKHKIDYRLLKEGIVKIYSVEEMANFLAKKGFEEIMRKNIRIYFMIKAIK